MGEGSRGRRRGTAAAFAVLALACAARSPTLASSAASAPAAPGTAPTVILISLDGVRHDYLGRGELPALTRLARQGLRAERLVSVLPSSTFPAHVSLATGTMPDVHGILDNTFWDRERGEFDYSNDASWIQAEPLWVAAERQGVPSATFFWVGSETDWNGVGARHRVGPFDRRVGEAEKVSRILAWLDLPGPDRPRLVMTWWHGADHAGHRRGPDHPDVAVALAEQDRQLAVLLAGLDARAAWSHTTLVVVSDHGMTTAQHTVPLRSRLRDAGLTPKLVVGAAVAHLFAEDADTLVRAERALAGLAGVAVHRGDALPPALRLGHPTRTGDLVVLASPPYTFRSGRLLDRLGDLLGSRRGLHGYAPEHPDMAGILLALGRGVPPGSRPGPVRAIDVAPTIAALLGIEPPRHAEGRSILD